MANKFVTDLTADVTVKNTDVYHVIDTTDVSQNAAGSSYKITWATLKAAILGYFSAGVGITYSGGVISSDPTATQTLTNKTLTSPTINTPTITNPTITGGGSFASPTLTTPVINGAMTGTTVVPVINGGTGLATLTANSLLVGNGTSNPTSIAPGTSGNVLTSTGTVWASTAPAGTSKNGVTTYDLTTASGVQNIAHGLAVIPKNIKITWVVQQSNLTTGVLKRGFGTYNGALISSIYETGPGSGGTFGNITTYTSTSSIILHDQSGGGSTLQQSAVPTFDSTNIILTWTKTNSPTGTLQIMWEAYS